jgi:hypothetical protein
VKLTKTAMAIASLGVAATVAVTGFSAPALASSSKTCTALPYWVIGNRTCKTGQVHSNSHHDLRIVVKSDVVKCAKSPWDVWDVNTGKVIASGSSIPRNVVVHGLYGTYEGRLNDACYKDTLTLQDY